MYKILTSKENIDLIRLTASKLLKIKNIFFTDSEILNSIEFQIKHFIESNEAPKNSYQFEEANFYLLTQIVKELEKVYTLKLQDIENQDLEEVFRSSTRSEVNISERSMDTRTNILEQNDF